MQKTPNTHAKGFFKRTGEPLQCAVCRSDGFKRLYSGFEKNGQSYAVYLCPNRHLAVTSLFPNPSQSKTLYSPETYRAHGRRFIYPVEWLIRRFRTSRLKRLERLTPHEVRGGGKGSILDIGCGRGLFLSLMKAGGWNVAGTELNDETASYARDVLGLDVRTGRLEDAGFPDEAFEAVTLWHVLEHLPEPSETLKECLRLLKPGGLLVVSVPNIASLQGRISGRHWFHLDVPYHLYHFSEEGLRQLLSDCSFKVLDVKHFSCEFGPFGFMQSLYNMARIRHNLLYDTLKTRELKAGEISLKLYLHFLLMLALTPLVIPLSFMLSFIESFIGKGGSIEVYARKNPK